MNTIVTPVSVITLDSTRIVHSIKADLVARYFPPVVRLVQYDMSLPVIAVSLMQNGQTYTLPSGAAANIRVHKPDSTYVYNPALGCDSTRNIVYFEVSQAMAAANGDGLAIVEIVVDGDIAGSSLITLHFEDNPVPEDAIESSDEWETIYELGERIIASTVTPVSTAAGMTDHNVVYLYTGTETGWNQGHMYYYNGTTWVDAGIAVTDTTLSVAGLAADAKKTGDEITALKEDLEYGNLNQQIKIPFEIYSTNNNVGTIRNNRSSVEVLSNSKLKITDTTSTAKTYGMYSEFVPYGSSTVLYVALKGLSANYTNFSNYRVYISQNGTSITGGTSVDFTGNNYYIIFVLPSVDVSKKLQFNLLAVDTTNEINGYFTVDAVQVVDLTKMFGSGDEPTIAEFNDVYASGMPYPQLLPEISADTRTIKYEINKYNDSISYEVINNIDEMQTVTKDRVLVLHNNSPYGDGGACWFEYLDYATEYGYARADGGKMYPMLDQAPLLASDPPIKRMMSLISSYVENTDLVYGRTGTLFDGTTTNELDCSSFVSAVLNGISYYSSKYVGDNNSRVAQLSSYAPVKTSTYGHVVTRLMAQYFAERKWLHSMPTETALKNVLQFGDILFSYDGTTEAQSRYLKIGHVSIVLSVTDTNRVIVAQCGDYPSAVVDHDNSSTAGKISTLILSSANLSAYFSAFARIPYINKDIYTQTGNEIKPVFIPNTYVNASNKGTISSSSLGATSMGYIEVIPQSQVVFTGAKTYNSKTLIAEVAEYDDHLKFIARTGFTNTPLTLNAATRYIKFSYAHSTGDGAMLLDDCNQFSAKITLP